MKAFIDVLDQKERDLIAQGLCDPSVRALVKVMAVLLPLDNKARARVLTQIMDELEIEA